MSQPYFGQPPLNQRRAITGFCWIIALGFLAEIVQVLWQIHRGQPWPISPPMHYPRDVFMDFFNTNAQSMQANPYGEHHQNYWPFTLLIARLMAKLGDYSVSPGYARISVGGALSFLLFTGSYVATLTWVGRMTWDVIKNGSPVSRRFLMAIFFLNAPFIVSIDRSNYVNLTFVFFAIFILSEDKRSISSIIALACACALKPYLGVCVVALVGFFGWKEFSIFGLGVIAVNAIGIVALGLRNVFSVGSNMAHYGDRSTLAQKLYENISLSNLVSPLEALNIGSQMSVLATGFYGCLGLYLLALMLRRLPLNQKLFCATIVGIALPPLAYQYNLILLIPFWPFLMRDQDWRFGSTVLILTALTFIWWHHWTLFSGPMQGIPVTFQLHVTEQTFIIPLLLATILLLSVIRTPPLLQEKSVVK